MRSDCVVCSNCQGVIVKPQTDRQNTSVRLVRHKNVFTQRRHMLRGTSALASVTLAYTSQHRKHSDDTRPIVSCIIKKICYFACFLSTLLLTQLISRTGPPVLLPFPLSLIQSCGNNSVSPPSVPPVCSQCVLFSLRRHIEP